MVLIAVTSLSMAVSRSLFRFCRGQHLTFHRCITRHGQEHTNGDDHNEGKVNSGQGDALAAMQTGFGVRRQRRWVGYDRYSRLRLSVFTWQGLCVAAIAVLAIALPSSMSWKRKYRKPSRAAAKASATRTSAPLTTRREFGLRCNSSAYELHDSGDDRGQRSQQS